LGNGHRLTYAAQTGVVSAPERAGLGVTRSRTHREDPVHIRMAPECRTTPTSAGRPEQGGGTQCPGASRLFLPTGKSAGPFARPAATTRPGAQSGRGGHHLVEYPGTGTSH